MYQTFAYCYALKSVPALDVSSVTNFGSTFNVCYSLSRIEATGFRFSFAPGASLSADALNEIYTNLPTVTGQTITVTGNYGTSGDDPTIATAKGWTVVGS
jgi:surface protein